MTKCMGIWSLFSVIKHWKGKFLSDRGSWNYILSKWGTWSHAEQIQLAACRPFNSPISSKSFHPGCSNSHNKAPPWILFLVFPQAKHRPTVKPSLHILWQVLHSHLFLTDVVNGYQVLRKAICIVPWHLNKPETLSIHNWTQCQCRKVLVLLKGLLQVTSWTLLSCGTTVFKKMETCYCATKCEISVF